MSSINKNISVAEFYDGRSVFITGATGFLGKVLVEKLLYSCNGIDKIYILTRPKKGLTLNERVLQLTDSPAFTRLKDSRPEDLNKIIPVSGDLTAPGLGLSPEDENTLLEKVSVVFHSAATINFNQPLRVSLASNLEGTCKVLSLCKRMRHISALVHISTAFCNTDKEVVEERVYPPPVAIDEVYKYLEKHGDDQKATKKLLNGRPNTYTFTKSLTEAYLAEHHGDVPIVIMRPSIVIAALNEPLAGWLDGWQGNTTIIAMSARGFCRVVVCDPQAITDLIPVDYVVNMSIVAAVYSKKEEVLVYNCCTSGVNPITWQQVSDMFLGVSVPDHFHEMPHPGAVLTRSRVVLAILTLFGQTLPANLKDMRLLLRCKRTKYARLNRRLINVRDQVQYFSTRSWVMKSANAQELAASLSGDDAQRFPCNPAHIHWPSYIPIYYKGVKKFLFGNK